jgi:hypothetical protein
LSDSITTHIDDTRWSDTDCIEIDQSVYLGVWSSLRFGRFKARLINNRLIAIGYEIYVVSRFTIFYSPATECILISTLLAITILLIGEIGVIEQLIGCRQCDSRKASSYKKKTLKSAQSV